MRKGFTLIEMLVVVAIIAILVALVAGGIGGCGVKSPSGESYYDMKTTGVFQCVKTYTYTSGGGGKTSAVTSKRVDLRPLEGGDVITVACDDDWSADIRNSATLYAQFEEKNWYEITYIGFRDEYYSYFPLVKSVRKVDAPPPELEL